MRKKYLSFIFIFHLPCLMGDVSAYNGQDLLNDAVFESYLPLIMFFRNTEHSAGTVPVNLAVSPAVTEMMSRGSFRRRFEKYADDFARTLSGDMKFFAEHGKKRLVRAAEYWLDRLDGMISLYSDIDGDIVSELEKLGGRGLELMATTATSNCIPLISSDVEVRAQIRLGLKSFEETFGYVPHGFWLPFARDISATSHEKRLADGTERTDWVTEILADAGISYFVAQPHCPTALSMPDTDRNTSGEKNTQSEVPRGRTSETQIQEVPPRQGAGAGRRSIVSFEADSEYGDLIFPVTGFRKEVPEYLNTARRTFPGGIRYWNNTDGSDDLEERNAYGYETAEALASEKSAIFLDAVRSGAFGADRELAIVPFYTIFSGEPWHEAPLWIEKLFLNIDASGVKPTTVSDYLKMSKPAMTDSKADIVRYGEYAFSMLYNVNSEQILRRLHETEARFETVLTEECGSGGTELSRRVLKQMARELLILQSSDLQLLISENRHREYANRTVLHHLEQFDRLAEMWKSADISGDMAKELEMIERNDDLFSSIDLSMWKQ